MNRETAVLQFLQELSDSPPELPYEPTLFPMLFAITREGSRASVTDLSQLIKKSQKLAARVLAVANSPAYAPAEKISSIERAVAVLGFNEVRSIIIMASASCMAHKSLLPVHFDGVELWRHQILTAEIVKTLALLASAQRPQQMGQFALAPDELYAAGLLHDIGKVVLAAYRPQVWADIYGLTGPELSFAGAEQQYWGLTHGTIAAQVLRIWELPPLLTDVIEWHNHPQEAMGHKVETNLLAAANMLAHTPPEAEAPLALEVSRLLPEGLNPDMVARLVHQTVERSPATMLARLVRSSGC